MITFTTLVLPITLVCQKWKLFFPRNGNDFYHESIRSTDANLFPLVRNWTCMKTEAIAREHVRNIRLENQKMGLADIYQDKFVARSAEFLFQDKDVTTEKELPHPMTLRPCTVNVVIAW
jgi:hypothetical protein